MAKSQSLEVSYAPLLPPHGRPALDLAETLAIVVSIAFDRDRLVERLTGAGFTDDELAPQSARCCAAVAEAACRREQCWDGLVTALDERLADWLPDYAEAPPIEIMRLFTTRSRQRCGLELTAALWSMLRRSSPGLEKITRRLGSELSGLALRRFGASDERSRRSRVCALG